MKQSKKTISPFMKAVMVSAAVGAGALMASSIRSGSAGEETPCKPPANAEEPVKTDSETLKKARAQHDADSARQITAQALLSASGGVWR